MLTPNPADTTLDTLLAPGSIAIVGASENVEKIGGRPLKFLLDHGFAGPIYPINPKRDVVRGLRAYPSLDALPDPVDHAILAVPDSAVPEAIAQCLRQGVRGATIFSSGFAETGDAGRRRQAEIARRAADGGLRLLGPNCMGFINMRTQAICSFGFMVDLGLPALGRTALVSQSGAFGGQALVMARERGIALGAWVTTGNEADVELADCIAHYAADPEIDVIMGYMEGCKSPDRLVRALELAADAGKPVVMVKAGRSKIGAGAVQSHTGALSGNDRVFDTVFERYGVHRAASVEAFFDIAYALGKGRLPRGNRLGVFTVSGGIGVLAADAAEAEGLALPPLPTRSRDRLAELLPHAAVANPVDGTAQIWSDMAVFEEFLDTLAEDGGYDALLLSFTAMPHAPHLKRPLLEALDRLRRKIPERPVVVSMLAPEDVRRTVEEMGYLLIEDTTRAIAVLSALHRLKQAQSRRQETPPAPHADMPPLAARQTESRIRAVLADFGLAGPEEIEARTVEAARAAAEKIGYPVALKVLSPDIAHKSDIGGVALALGDAEAVTAAWHEIMRTVEEKRPDAGIEGALVMRMAPDGVDMIAGLRRDPMFGPVLLAGFGGVAAELYEDVALRLAPVSRSEALDMIRELACAPLLEGFRGAPPADIDALADALVTLSRMETGLRDDVTAVEVNPLRVLPKGQGVLALDAAIEQRAEE